AFNFKPSPCKSLMLRLSRAKAYPESLARRSQLSPSALASSESDSSRSQSPSANIANGLCISAACINRCIPWNRSSGLADPSNKCSASFSTANTSPASAHFVSWDLVFVLSCHKRLRPVSSIYSPGVSRGSRNKNSDSSDKSNFRASEPSSVVFIPTQSSRSFKSRLILRIPMPERQLYLKDSRSNLYLSFKDSILVGKYVLA